MEGKKETRLVVPMREVWDSRRRVVLVYVFYIVHISMASERNELEVGWPLRRQWSRRRALEQIVPVVALPPFFFISCPTVNVVVVVR
jgi:hypothetical protein